MSRMMEAGSHEHEAIDALGRSYNAKIVADEDRWIARAQVHALLAIAAALQDLADRQPTA